MYKLLQRPALLAMAATAALSVSAACGTSNTATQPSPSSSASEPNGGTAVTVGTRPADTGAPTGTPPPPSEPTFHNLRYCEILTVSPDSQGALVAEVWNTMGLNECPQEAWDAVDLEQVKAITGAALASTNGPRYWVLDRILPGTGMPGSMEVKDLDGVEMRSMAFVELPSEGPEAASYGEISVQRDTVFTFLAGRQVYELTAPDGSIYIMQSFSLQVDPAQTVDDLADLGDRLKLPDGWTFTSRVLSEDLNVEDLDGVATVVTDDLQNTYQLRSRG